MSKTTLIIMAAGMGILRRAGVHLHVRRVQIAGNGKASAHVKGRSHQQQPIDAVEPEGTLQYGHGAEDVFDSIQRCAVDEDIIFWHAERNCFFLHLYRFGNALRRAAAHQKLAHPPVSIAVSIKSVQF